MMSMKHKGPVVTLLVGLAVALTLLGLNLDATKKARDRNRPADPAAATGALTTPTATPILTTAPPPPAATTAAATAATKVTYAGSTVGGQASIAIAVADGHAVAYLCDGQRAEAWLQGTANDGKLNLSGTGGASLTGTVGNGVAAGTVVAAGKSWSFSVKTVKAPSGLYRSSANVRNATVVGGWIVLANGKQVGVLSVAGQPEPAPALNLAASGASGTVTVDGVTLTALPLDGSAL